MDRSLRDNLTPYAFVLGGVMLGGLSPVFTKLLLLRNVEGPTIVAARYLLTVLLLTPFGLPHKRPAGAAQGRPDRRAWLTLFLVGAFGSGLGALLFTAAVDLASAGVVNAISKTAPIFVALFAYFTLRERVTYLRFLLVAVMVAADLLIAAGELSFSGQLVSARLLGDLLALAAGMTRAAAEILGKSALQQFTPTTVALWRFGVGLMVAGAVSVGTGGYASLLGMGAHGWLILVALAGVSTALYMALYYRGLSEIPAHVAVTLKLLGAIVTVIVSWIVLGEALTPYHIAGIAVLISGAYLLVMRTAGPTAEQAEPRPAVRPWTRLRPRMVGLVVLLVLASVGVVWYLSMRHSVHLLRQQVQLTVGEVAAILVEFGGLEERPSWQSYQQYLRRVVGHRVEGDMYALEVVYVAALDGRGNIGAFAIVPDLRVVSGDRDAYAVRDREAMRRLLAVMDRDASSYGIITASAQLIDDGRRIGMLKMGCRREMAEGMVGEIVGRSAVAALTVLLLAAAIAALVVGGMVEPIERLASDLSARGRDSPDSTEAYIDEVEQIRRALSVVGRVVGVERQALAQMSLTLAEAAVTDHREVAPDGGAWLCVAPHEGPDVELLAACVEAAARESARQGGALSAVSRRGVFARWAGERDDALRAVLAARAIAEELAGRDLPQPVAIIVGEAGDAPAWSEALAAASDVARGRDETLVAIGPEAAAQAAEHIMIAELADAAGFVEVTGLAEPAGLDEVAREPDD